MSSTITGFGGSNLGQLSALVADNDTITARLDQLEQQASTGYVAPTLGGLGGTAARQVLDLRPQIAQNGQYQANINAVQGQLSTTQSALSSISTIASQFYADLPNLSSVNPSEIDSIAQQAKQALSQVASLIDTKDGDTYVFAGQTPGTAPISNPDAIASSAFVTNIASQVAGLGANGGPATAAGTLSAAVANSPFASTLSSAVPTVQVSPSEFVQVGVLANKNTLATSSGSSTTGSYMTDILRSLATLASLSSAQANLPGFSSLVQDTSQSLSGAISTLNNEAGALGNIQSNLTARGTDLGTTQTALKGQLSSATDVDMAATLTSLTQTQTQLQASYQVIASTKNLSLANYL
jgi:flagellar hook-associated protein 3 FlgL